MGRTAVFVQGYFRGMGCVFVQGYFRGMGCSIVVCLLQHIATTDDVFSNIRNGIDNQPHSDFYTYPNISKCVNKHPDMVKICYNETMH
jgi:hypothetical protein